MRKMTIKILISSLSFIALLACNPAKLRRHGDAGGEMKNSSHALTSGEGSTNHGQQEHYAASGFERCENAKSLQARDLGYIKACQNTHDPTQFRFQVSQGRGEICLVPIGINAAGKSIPLRFKAACQQTKEGETYNVTLPTNETDAANLACFGCRPNGLIFLEKNIVPHYFRCAQASRKYLENPRHCCRHAINQVNHSYCNQSNTPHPGTCRAYAEREKNSHCTPFVRNYKNLKYLIYPFP